MFRLNRGSLLFAISVWTDEESKSLAESFGADALLDKMDLANRLIPTIMHLITPSADSPVEA
jgi:hypothetical protein